MTEKHWPIRLFEKSVLKQRKYREITELLGNCTGLHCLDIGADNGVISYLFRRRGGEWKSADLEADAVRSIRELVGDNVFQIDGKKTPFADNQFDRAVIIDFLEHIESDREFVEELQRILKPGGELIINVPFVKNSGLRKLRLAIGQTDEKHGHVRHGYTVESLRELLGDRFSMVAAKTYSKFFSEFVDTVLTFAIDWLKKGQQSSQKGRIVTGNDLARYQKLFKLYSLIYPIVWAIAQLDNLLFWRSGYMLIVKTQVIKLERGDRGRKQAAFSGQNN
ncbi:methyltransferase domain-containing protein [Oxynema sp. CENA135]|uniref:class I SAM-dependent methyltransferase n=1 Tax=Oxynema sp. CENA135 TaxID=984206 RepID=UPI00190D34BF|nr:class I SAM-dependent methyltransferase [Oxynema sp. CENA135]MBK4729875.1 methyltransferase domain-containing protein [Oxynema sp. CENA135]